MADHRSKYKNTGLDSQELRRRREEGSIQLRKQKRDDILSKRRMGPVDSPAEQPLDCITLSDGPLSSDDGSITAEMIDGIMQRHDDKTLVECAEKVRRILSKEPQPPIDEVIASGVMPRLIELLDREDDVKIQFEVAWILTNIASGSTDQTRVVVELGAVPKFVKMLESPETKVAEQAVWALGNVIGDGPQFREIVVKHGFAPAILKLIKPDIDLGFLRNIVWALVNLCRNKDPPPSIELIKLICPALSYLITTTHVPILSDTLWALSYITECGPEYGQILIETGLVKAMTPFICHPEIKIQTATIRALGSLATGTDEQTQAVIDAGSLKYLHEIFTIGKDRIIKESLWFLSNITAGSHDQIQEVINLKMLPMIIMYLERGDYDAQKEAAWVVYNLTISGTAKQIKELLDENVIPPLCNLLSIKDKNILYIVLETIMNILKSSGSDVTEVAETIEACGGLDRIEKLQESDNTDIYNTAYKIIDKYFNDNEDTEFDNSVEVL